MITTNCDSCCFLKQDDQGKGCALGQWCVSENDKTHAPGYCRLCRSRKWYKKQDTTDLKILCEQLTVENVLKFDMLVFFDEATNTIDDLKKTLDSRWYGDFVEKIIIVDTTGFGPDRENLAMQYLNSKEHLVPTVVDSSVEHESQLDTERTIHRLVKQITAPFFMAIPAGRIVKNLDALNVMVQHMACRVVHWSFIRMIGTTTIVSQKLCNGLFITKPYKAIMKIPEVELFTEQLQIEESETTIMLTIPCWNCLLV